MEDLLQVGGIANTHGVRGEVKVFPTTDDPKRFKKCKQIKLDTGKGYLDLEVEQVKFFKQFVILKFKGYDSIEAIEKFKGKPLYVTRENAVKLQKDEYFIADMIGMNVYNEQDHKIAELVDVMQTGANDVYVLKMEETGEEVLIPAIKECILDVNLEQHRMTIHMLEGLV